MEKPYLFIGKTIGRLVSVGSHDESMYDSPLNFSTPYVCNLKYSEKKQLHVKVKYWKA